MWYSPRRIYPLTGTLVREYSTIRQALFVLLSNKPLKRSVSDRNLVSGKTLYKLRQLRERVGRVVVQVSPRHRIRKQLLEHKPVFAVVIALDNAIVFE